MTSQEGSEVPGRIAEIRNVLEKLKPVLQEQFAKGDGHRSIEGRLALALKAELDWLEYLQQIEAIENVGEA